MIAAQGIISGRRMFRKLILPIRRRWRRDTYTGALIFNLCSFILPALYGTLVKLWVAKIDSRMVITTDTFTYINTIAEVLNEGLPRAAWSTIGDASLAYSQRLSLTYTLITVQSILGLIMSISLLAGAASFASVFVPIEVRRESITYVRISAFSALSSSTEAAVTASTRALDRPDVPLVVSSIKFLVNIVLDLLLISTFHVGDTKPTVNMQAAIQLICNLVAAIGGLTYFLLMVRRRHKDDQACSSLKSPRPSMRALRILIPPGIPTFVESAIRNALYLWLITNIVSLGTTYATAWGVFNTIRWGLVMVPVSALEATTSTFVGHNWGLWKDRRLQGYTDPPTSVEASSSELLGIARPAFASVAIALVFEVPLCVFLSLFGARSFARFLSGSDTVAQVTTQMWKSIDWCYILYAVTTQLAAVLLATRPKWFLWQSLATNLLYVLPWAIACQVAHLDQDNAWKYHALVFGGSLVFSFICVPIVLGLWAWVLKTGRAHLKPTRPL